MKGVCAIALEIDFHQKLMAVFLPHKKHAGFDQIMPRSWSRPNSEQSLSEKLCNVLELMCSLMYVCGNLG